jgi:hypothetical protein
MHKSRWRLSGLRAILLLPFGFAAERMSSAGLVSAPMTADCKAYGWEV